MIYHRTISFGIISGIFAGIIISSSVPDFTKIICIIGFLINFYLLFTDKE
jgi:hypothetical protein